MGYAWDKRVEKHLLRTNLSGLFMRVVDHEFTFLYRHFRFRAHIVLHLPLSDHHRKFTKLIKLFFIRSGKHKFPALRSDWLLVFHKIKIYISRIAEQEKQEKAEKDAETRKKEQTIEKKFEEKRRKLEEVEEPKSGGLKLLCSWIPIYIKNLSIIL